MNRKITKSFVASVKAPATGEEWIWDTELPGFGLRIRSSGRKTYVVRYRTKDAKGTQRKITVCRSSDAPPDKARAMARDIFMSVAAGEDPMLDRRRCKEDDRPTIEEMFQGYVDNLRAKGKFSADNAEHALLTSSKAIADSLGRDTAPADVTPNDIIKRVSKFYKDGFPGAANKARGYIHAAYGWAIKSANDYTVDERKDWGVTFNPASAVAKDPNAQKVRDRNLSAEEIRYVWDACDDGSSGLTQGVAILLQTMICCGQRVMETLRMCGEDIDLEAGIWKIPAHKTKGKKRDHTIPLSVHIIPKLRMLKEKHGDGPLFPSRTASKEGLLGAVAVSSSVRSWVTSKEWEETKFETFQPRDLRRTWKSRTHDAGIDRFMRDKIQQHSMNDTGSKNHDRADYLPEMKEAMKKWDAWLEVVLNGDPEPVRLVA